ncbi:MAG TPA: hypothetical protein VFD16_02735, partial [Candidatus Saccharimonadales bacterium]|nr:hypothetical protein [Candidatus Saccharimonadales bacterium]
NDDRSGSGTGFDSNFDSRLMGKDGGSDSQAKAGALNEAKHQSENNDESPAGEPTSLREAVIAEKRKQEQEKQGKSSSLKQKATAPMRRGTSKLLQSAWINLIPSFGLTLIWINIHAFLSLVIGKDVFCRLGDEWLDGALPGGGAAQQAALGEAGKKISGCANIGESMVLAILDLVLLVVIIAIVAVIALLVKLVSDPVGFLASEFSLIWGVIKGAVVN